MQRIQPEGLTEEQLEEFNCLRDLLGCYKATLEQELGAEDLLAAFKWWVTGDTNLTLEDLAHAIYWPNRFSTSFFGKGSELVRELRGVNNAVSSFWSPSYKGGPVEAWQWFGQGLYLATSEMADFVIRNPQMPPADYRAKLNERIAECKAEAADDPDYDSPWDSVEIGIAAAWFSASPYVLWVMYRDAKQAGLDILEDELFAFACGVEDADRVGKAIQKSFEESVSAWMRATETALKARA